MALNPTKRCNKCGEVKVRADFYPHGKYITSWCRKCWQTRNVEAERRRRQTDDSYRARYNAKKNAQRRKRYAANPAYKATVLARNKAREQALKDRVFAAYGGYQCACCGETGRSFLSLDHMDNNGN